MEVIQLCSFQAFFFTLVFQVMNYATHIQTNLGQVTIENRIISPFSVSYLDSLDRKVYEDNLCTLNSKHQEKKLAPLCHPTLIEHHGPFLVL
jgi:hypothetical protein